MPLLHRYSSLRAVESICAADIFNYDLPAERIAQRPVRPYDHARMLVVDRRGNELGDSVFTELPRFVREGDLLVLNDTRVLPARLLGCTADTRASIELLCLHPEAPLSYVCMGKPMKRLRAGRRLIFAKGLEGEIVERRSDCEVLVVFKADRGDPAALLKEAGVMPIPPYIRKGRADEEDRADYQTFFARCDGSIAAPTAGLHFTPELCRSLEGAGCEIAFATLHVGAASFLAIMSAPDDEPKAPAEEQYFYSPDLLTRIAAVKERGGRVIAVGTTVVRALESMARCEFPEGRLISTGLFIRPGFRFKLVDALITNFHQPGTTHLLLVQAILGRRLLEQSYAHALSSGYRFLSYGDGMCIL